MATIFNSCQLQNLYVIIVCRCHAVTIQLRPINSYPDRLLSQIRPIFYFLNLLDFARHSSSANKIPVASNMRCISL